MNVFADNEYRKFWYIWISIAVYLHQRHIRIILYAFYCLFCIDYDAFINEMTVGKEQDLFCRIKIIAFYI